MLPQLGLYIHIPWCLKKCPYCDFNSHVLPVGDEQLFWRYVDALIDDATAQAVFAQGRSISSVFIGGGTPSLLPLDCYRRLFAKLKEQFVFTKDCEITLEANPGTLEYAPFEEYLALGINRLSLGVQTFDNNMLTVLGRVHDSDQAKKAIKNARLAGFTRVNVDLMHGLPSQKSHQALDDLHTAIDMGATHLSWYQLTIEPNTAFYRRPPTLPDDDALADIETLGMTLLTQAGFDRYEVSAWAGDDEPCRHNVNYWHFGDYLALGAGAHAKVTLSDDWRGRSDFVAGGVYRFSRSRLPRDYVSYQSSPKFVGVRKLSDEECVSEYMLNALRLVNGTSVANFEQNSRQSIQRIYPTWQRLKEQGLMVDDDRQLVATERGFLFVNQLVQAFL